MLAKDLYTSGLPVELPEDLVGILKDPQIEQAGEEFGTVFSNIVCPSAKEIWSTFGGYPAASQGAWARIPWPFERQKEE
jgi:hypothetical protein